MVNLARKADRIEAAMSGANASQDETIIDTAVDLFVYTIKYMTFLADQDPLVAAWLFPGQSSTSGFSDGVSGFDHLLAATAVSDGPESASVDTQRAAASVLSEFAQLEQCFDNTGPTCSPTARTMRAEALRAVTQQLITALRQEAPDSFELFVLTWSG